MPPTAIADLFAWEADANRAVVDAAERTPNLDARAWQVIGHLTVTPLVWLGRITRTEVPAVWPPTTAADAPVCRDRIGQAERGYAGLLEQTLSRDLAQAVQYSSTSGEAHATPLLGILLHVVTHGAYHRGQINQSIRSAGGDPVQQDYIYRVR